MPTISSPIDGTELRYDVTGEGQALVLLHGSVLSRAIWRGLGYLRPLAAEHTVIRMDLRGHGRSGTPHSPEAYSQRRLVADVLAVLDAEGHQHAALLGYSLGARIALSTALARPERVRRIVCIAGSAAAQRGQLESVFFPGVIDTVRSSGMEEFCARQGLGPGVASRRGQATRAAFLAADHLAMAALFTATDETPGIPDHVLQEAGTPALWMAGTEDHPRFEQSRRAAALMPRGRFVALPGRDHGGSLFPPDPVLEHALPFLRGEGSQTN